MLRFFMLYGFHVIPAHHPQYSCSVFLTMVRNDNVDTADRIESSFAFEQGEVCRGVLVNVERID
jgi:hypothetical protein